MKLCKNDTDISIVLHVQSDGKTRSGSHANVTILSRARSSIAQCSSDNPSLLAQDKVVANQLQVKHSEWVT